MELLKKCIYTKDVRDNSAPKRYPMLSISIDQSASINSLLWFIEEMNKATGVNAKLFRRVADGLRRWVPHRIASINPDQTFNLMLHDYEFYPIKIFISERLRERRAGGIKIKSALEPKTIGDGDLYWLLSYKIHYHIWKNGGYDSGRSYHSLENLNEDGAIYKKEYPEQLDIKPKKWYHCFNLFSRK